MKHCFSTGLFQVSPEPDSQMRFSDNLDRLYITRLSFEADLIMSDQLVDQSENIILAADKTMNEGVPHLITYSDKIRVYWRTTVQNSQHTSAAAGFRMLAYPSSMICFCS